jgi:hypothetical protein
VELIARVAEPVERADVLWINVIFKEARAHLEEGRGRQQTVRACLMLRSYPWDLELVCNILQASLEGLAASHKVL